MNKIPTARVNLAARKIDVTHSKILAGRFETDTLRDPSWHALATTAYAAGYQDFSRKGLAHLEILKKLSDISGATVKSGEYSRGSFTYCSAIRGSIQERSANGSLRIAKRLAQEIEGSFEITIQFPHSVPQWGGQDLTLWWNPDAIFEL